MKKYLPTIAIILIFICGIGVFLYPTISNYLYEENSSQAIESHTQKIEKMSEDELQKEKDAVKRYNESLFKNSVVLTDPFDPNAFPITDGEYTELLAQDEVMAYIEIPAINVYLPIYHGTSDEVLGKGVGHLENTSLPMGSETTHTVLSAHCGLPSARLFTDLTLLKKGNTFRIHVLDEELLYKIYDIKVVEPDDTSALHIQKGKDLVTLITCTPYGENTHRLLVFGERIEAQKEEEISEPEIPQRWGWENYTMLIAVVLVVIFIFILAFSGLKTIFSHKKGKYEKVD